MWMHLSQVTFELFDPISNRLIGNDLRAGVLVEQKPATGQGK